MSESWTLRRVLKWTADDFAARGLASPRLDAELLAAHALGVPRVKLYVDLDRPLSTDELGSVRALVQRRRRHEPIAYIVGQREFYGRLFEVTAAVLVPRPDTETLVERALESLPSDRDATAIDLCTGSGCVAVTLAAERPRCSVVATDVSEAALAIAARNAARHGVSERVRLARGDLFEALPAGLRADVLTANPPYLAERELAACMPDVREHEPRLALVAGPRGDEVLARIVAGAAAHLAPAGRVLVEVGAGQARAVARRFEAAGFLGVRVHADLGGVERVVEAAREPLAIEAAGAIVVEPFVEPVHAARTADLTAATDAEGADEPPPF